MEGAAEAGRNSARNIAEIPLDRYITPVNIIFRFMRYLDKFLYSYFKN
jgi:hypothetical protein